MYANKKKENIYVLDIFLQVCNFLALKIFFYLIFNALSITVNKQHIHALYDPTYIMQGPHIMHQRT